MHSCHIFEKSKIGTTKAIPGVCNPDKHCNLLKSLSSAQFSRSVVSDSLWPHGLQHTRSPCPSPTPRLKLMSIESVMPSNHLILCRPLLILPSIFPSIKVFSNESALLMRWAKCWSFSFNISPSSEHPGLISLKMDWLDLPPVQGTLKSLLQHHSSKASILQSVLSFLYSPTLTFTHGYWKTIALTRWTFAGNVMYLLFISNFFFKYFY